MRVAADGQPLTAALAERVATGGADSVEVVPFVGTDVVFLTADEEAMVMIASGTTPLDATGNIVAGRVQARQQGRLGVVDAVRCAYLDAAPGQVVGAGAGLIPFLEHDDPTRAQMGAAMQRQALPLLRPEAPLVGTGLEAAVARDSGWLVVADAGGTVVSATAAAIVVAEAGGRRRRYPLRTFERTNQATCRHQRPCVRRGERVVAGQALADGSATAGGELALGRNALVAFLAWDGATYEDAIVIRAGFVQGDGLTSLHLEEHTLEVRDTPAGMERLTRAVPHVGDRALAHLDERGIARLGARVGPGDLLVGKVTPRADADADGAETLARDIADGAARRRASATGSLASSASSGGTRSRTPRCACRRGRAASSSTSWCAEAATGSPLPHGVRATGARHAGPAPPGPGRRQARRAARQQGRRLPDRGRRGHAVPARRPADRRAAEPAGRAQPHEPGPTVRDAARLGLPGAGLAGGRARLRRPGRRRRAAACSSPPACPPTARSRSTTAGRARPSPSR